ncbi:MAG: division/cell wall cluster transcriptional repressor MraZ [Stygiobacter sp.]|nr:MAG: division/cell wall cluster transcriptional repressor MraZ [Stygiobacter sp.]
MFIGSFKYSVDAKGRISIPAKFKKVLKPEAKDTFVMTRSTVQCIDVYPYNYWEEKIKPRIDALDDFNIDEAAFKRFLFELASDQELDKQSRLFLPKSLLEFAGIDKEVLILGQNNKIEFWNPEIFETQKREFPKPFAELAKQVMNSQK